MLQCRKCVSWCHSLGSGPHTYGYGGGEDITEINASASFQTYWLSVGVQGPTWLLFQVKKLLSEKQKIGALGNGGTVVTCSHPPLLLLKIRSAWWWLKGGSCASVLDPKSLSKNERGEAVIAHSTGVNVRSQPQIKQAGRKKKKAQSRQ